MQKEEIIKPQSSFSLNFKEIWDARELFYYFAWRDIKVKYKQTLFGFLWAIIQPLAMMGILYFFMSKKVEADGLKIPYLIYSLSGLIIWNIFSTGVTNAGNSMMQNANIIKKIYFPRLIIPVSSIIVGIFDFIWALVLFLILTISLYGFDYFHLLTPIYFLAGICYIIFATFGLGNFIASFTVKYKDFRHALPFLIQLMLLASSVIYPLQFIENTTIKYILSLNPCVGGIELFRAGITNYEVDYTSLGINFLFNCIIFIFGLINFRRTERYLADTI